MPLSTGLLALQGVAEGLKSGLNTYRDERRYQDERQQRQATLGLLADKEGMSYDPESGLISPTAAGLAKRSAEQAQSGLTEAQAKKSLQTLNEGSDATSKTSENARLAGRIFSRSLQSSPTFKKSPELQELNDRLLNGSADEINAIVEHPAIKQSLSTVLGEDRLKAMLNALGTKQEDKANKEQGAVFDKIRKDKEWVKYDGMVKEGNDLKDTIASAVTNPAAANAVGVYAARFATGGQRLNQMEIQALGQGEKDVLGRLNQVMTTAGKGTLTPENAKFMQDFVEARRAAAEASRDEIEDGFVGSFARTHKMAPDAASGLILGRPTAATRKKNAPPASPPAAGLLPKNKDAQYIEWAKKNPNDPDAQEILRLNGVK